MQRSASIDLDETTRCPGGKRCENCLGAERLAVVTVWCAVGVFCMTLCLACGVLSPPDASGTSEVTRRVRAHCQHLGIDADQMAVREG